MTSTPTARHVYIRQGSRRLALASAPARTGIRRPVRCERDMDRIVGRMTVGCECLAPVGASPYVPVTSATRVRRSAGAPWPQPPGSPAQEKYTAYDHG